MNPSPITIGLAMIGLGAVAVAWAHGPLTVVSSFALVPLVLGGAAVLLRRPGLSFWVGIAGGLVVVLAGAAGVVLKRDVGLPIGQPLVVLVLGLYICFRLVLARRSLEAPASRGSGARERRSIADQLVDDMAEEQRKQQP